MAQKKIKRTDNDNRKDNLDPDKDQFVTQTMSVMDWAYERRRVIAVALVVALLAAVAGIVVDGMVEKSRTDESGVLANGLSAAVAPVIPADDDVTPPPADDEEVLTFDSARARATEALSKFKTAAENTEDSSQLIAKLGTATAHLDLGDYEKAIAAYKEFLAAKDPAVDLMRPAAVEGLGYALLAAGKADEALKQFESLSQSETGTAANMARYQAARVALEKQDREKATKLLKEVIDTYTKESNFGRLDYLFVRAREQLLALDPGADIPNLPTGMGGFDFNNMDPRLLEQLRRANLGGGPS